MKKKNLVIAVLLAAPALARADSFSVGQIAQELNQEAMIPLAPSVGNQLAKNLLAAQDPAVCSYCASEPQSLPLSIDAVLRAISIYVFPGGPTTITDTDAPIVWAQSNIAIDTNTSVTLDPPSLNFTATVPEPSSFLLVTLGAVVLLLAVKRHA